MLSISDFSPQCFFRVMFLCEPVDALVMILKSDIKEIWGLLQVESHKLWGSVRFIVRESKDLLWNLIGVFPKIFLAKASTISLLPWKEPWLSVFKMFLSVWRSRTFFKISPLVRSWILLVLRVC